MANTLSCCRNASVFQFPDTMPMAADAFKQSSGMAKNEVKVEPTYATVVKPPAGAKEKSKEMTPPPTDINQKQMMPWPARERPQRPMFMMQQKQMMAKKNHHPNCNTQLRQSAPLFSQQQQQMIMTQSYPGPCILQPQKVASGASAMPENVSSAAKPMDKEFIAELEKNLGLVEANANIMPPSPSVTSTAASTVQPQPSNPTTSSVPLLPPPQATVRNSNRRSQQYSYSPPVPSPPQVQQALPYKREASLPRMANEGPLRVALPDETRSQASKNTAHVKPFLSPNAKQQQGRMGDVAAARDNWKPLSVGSGGSSSGGSASRDFLSDQKRQLAEIERLRGMQSSHGISRNSRSQSVLPPSGASRPTNHLEVNKMAQVLLPFNN